MFRADEIASNLVNGDNKSCLTRVLAAEAIVDTECSWSLPNRSASIFLSSESMLFMKKKKKKKKKSKQE